MTQTLIKSGTEPNLTADQEEHSFTYSLYPHAGTWREAGTVQEALNLNVPAKLFWCGRKRPHGVPVCRQTQRSA